MARVPDKILKLVCKQLGVVEGRVKPEASFIDDLGADSLDILELRLVFEETFDIEIPDEEAGRIRIVQDAIVAVEKCLPAQRRD